MSLPNQSKPRLRLALCLSRARSFIANPGQSGLTEAWPWVIAFTFGLLHGLGFAGALREVGLPQNAIPLALLFFNVGVEARPTSFHHVGDGSNHSNGLPR